MKIVLVDDSSTNVIILRKLCGKIDGAEPIAFTDSETAIEYLMVNEVAIVVVDYSMPRITGIELVKRLRASPRHGETPVVMLTASTEIAVRRRALEVGVSDFLTKPVRTGPFLDRLTELLSAGKPSRENVLI